MCLRTIFFGWQLPPPPPPHDCFDCFFPCQLSGQSLPWWYQIPLLHTHVLCMGSGSATRCFFSGAEIISAFAKIFFSNFSSYSLKKIEFNFKLHSQIWIWYTSIQILVWIFGSTYLQKRRNFGKTQEFLWNWIWKVLGQPAVHLVALILVYSVRVAVPKGTLSEILKQKWHVNSQFFHWYTIYTLDLEEWSWAWPSWPCRARVDNPNHRHEYFMTQNLTHGTKLERNTTTPTM